jgi:putative membrane protein
MKNVIKLNRLLMVGLMAACLASCGKKAETDSKEVAEETNKDTFEDTDTKRDAEFAVAAADGGLLEVRLGELAVSQASAASVKKFGQSMIDDHSKANEELKALAAKKNIALPTSLSEKNQKKYDELSGKSGAEFDKAYASFMVDDHKEDIEEFKKEAEKGNDADVKAWASGKIPVLEHHLMMAQAANDEVGKR